MTDETSQTSQTATGQTTQSAQATQATQATQPVQSAQEAQTAQATNQITTDQPVAKELTQNEFWVSGMLNGTFYECDGPYYTTKDVPAENYPYTAVKPDPNFTSQKYDYINHKWVDTSADALLHEIESIKTDINGFQQTATALQQGLASQSQAQGATDEEAEKTMSLLSMVVKQVGAISDKIDGISTNLNENSVTAQTATTAQTADETKKEGTN